MSKKNRKPWQPLEPSTDVSAVTASESFLAPEPAPEASFDPEPAPSDSKGEDAPERTPGQSLCRVADCAVNANGKRYEVGYEGLFADSDIDSLPTCLIRI